MLVMLICFVLTANLLFSALLRGLKWEEPCESFVIPLLSSLRFLETSILVRLGREGKMRLLRRVIPPANGGFCQKFQLFRIIEVSRSHIHTGDATALSFMDFLCLENPILLIGQIYSGSSSRMLYPLYRILWKSVSHEEWDQGMSANLWWRTMSGSTGKFPFISEAQKEVGGNFYIIRNIQELEHESLVNAKVNNTFMRGRLKISAGTREVSQPESVVEGVSRVSENDQSEDIGTQPHNLAGKSASSLDPRLPSHKFQPKTGRHESSESGISNRESDQVHSENAESVSKSSIWQNLKSFASGIFGR